MSLFEHVRTNMWMFEFRFWNQIFLMNKILINYRYRKFTLDHIRGGYKITKAIYESLISIRLRIRWLFAVFKSKIWRNYPHRRLISRFKPMVECPVPYIFFHSNYSLHMLETFFFDFFLYRLDQFKMINSKKKVLEKF